MPAEVRTYHNGLEMQEKRTALSQVETAGLTVDFLALGYQQGRSVRSTGDDSVSLTEVFVWETVRNGVSRASKSIYVRDLVRDEINRANLSLETFTPGYTQRVSWHENGVTSH